MNDIKKTLCRPCPICNSIYGEVLHTQKFILSEDSPLPKEYDVVSCTKCGFTYADTDADQQIYDSYYKILSKYEDKNSTGGGYTDFDLKRNTETVKEIERSFPDKHAKIIDIGCANGGILKILNERGYLNLKGFDPSKKCVENVKNHGISCIQGSIFDANKILHNQKFDYVILSHVIEHIYDLKRALNICFELLNETGQLYIEVPDAAFYADYYVIPYYYFDSEHINHFDAISLSNMGITTRFKIKNIGHKTITISQTQLYPALFAIFEKNKETLPLQFSTLAKESILKYLNLSAQNSHITVLSELAKTQEEIIVFGAGNYTLRLLASTDLGKCNIKVFIDNDFIKQGHLLKNKSIVSPDILNDYNGTVVISSALFAQEIEKQVKLINPNLNKIIILR
jgi:2-polyprenyl-3-methyl-5-hydroxy-6-metoxy-1,4-benzoquinol methylase